MSNANAAEMMGFLLEHVGPVSIWRSALAAGTYRPHAVILTNIEAHVTVASFTMPGFGAGPLFCHLETAASAPPEQLGADLLLGLQMMVTKAKNLLAEIGR